MYKSFCLNHVVYITWYENSCFTYDISIIYEKYHYKNVPNFKETKKIIFK